MFGRNGGVIGLPFAVVSAVLLSFLVFTVSAFAAGSDTACDQLGEKFLDRCCNTVVEHASCGGLETAFESAGCGVALKLCISHCEASCADRYCGEFTGPKFEECVRKNAKLIQKCALGCEKCELGCLTKYDPARLCAPHDMQCIKHVLAKQESCLDNDCYKGEKTIIEKILEH